MDEHGHHQDLMKEVSEEYSDLFEGSAQGMYIYLDDGNKICNEKFSEMLGYSSPKEWSGVEESFTEAFVADNSREDLVGAFQSAMEEGTGSQLEISWLTKSSEEVDSEVILVPIVFAGHLMALHFIEKK
jgi:PAS domain-containing protein